MEFPDLGAHCSEPSCQRLDFLPLKCDACSGIFCADHVAYAQHHCGSAYQKDIQVPVCPLCNVPVPVARGEPPDRAVGEHIDRDCRFDPAQQKRKTCCPHQSTRFGFCGHHLQPKSDLAVTYLSQQTPNLLNICHRATAQSPSRTSPPVIALQNGLSEDEALQRALELSLAEAKPQVPSSQEEDDLALAQALSASEAEYQRQQAQSRNLKPSNCSLC
ncbi:AN1-type zinc finger protein 2B [Galemys pyrenaicus]|uniref:AN1-type zinc finger protein 2B n=1 Tax=Galemys pyrenaicus TaxID=202257 RepID=A0A8J6AHF3_GALPY|nr:AN1-type zinc finger protein 2B [Galemys pyrenaicus]